MIITIADLIPSPSTPYEKNIQKNNKIWSQQTVSTPSALQQSVVMATFHTHHHTAGAVLGARDKPASRPHPESTLNSCWSSSVQVSKFSFSWSPSEVWIRAAVNPELVAAAVGNKKCCHGYWIPTEPIQKQKVKLISLLSYKGKSLATACGSRSRIWSFLIGYFLFTLRDVK